VRGPLAIVHTRSYPWSILKPFIRCLIWIGAVCAACGSRPTKLGREPQYEALQTDATASATARPALPLPRAPATPPEDAGTAVASAPAASSAAIVAAGNGASDFEPTLAECASAVRDATEYQRLMRAALHCVADAECKVVLPVNPCSACSIAVSSRSPHIARLRELKKRIPRDDRCSMVSCKTSYNCSWVLWAKCTDGRCRTTVGEPEPECGSPSPMQGPLP